MNINDSKMINLEKSIMFMQQDHANTLKGLHSEIEKLQARCSELTFQLAMETTSTPDAEELKNKASWYENDLKQTITDMKAVKKENASLAKTVNDLQTKLDTLNNNYETILKERDEKIRTLQRENNEKADEIARLQMSVLTNRTQQIKKSPKAVYVQSPRGSSGSRESSSLSLTSSLEGPDIMGSDALIISQPPLHREAPLTNRKVKRSGQQPRVLNAVKNRPASGRLMRVESALTDEGTNDPSDILQIAREQRANLRQGKGPVVPPIWAQEQRRESLHVTHIEPLSRIDFPQEMAAYKPHHRDEAGKESPEIEVLAIDIHKKIRKAHRFQEADT